MPQERACPFLWSSATTDAGGVHFEVFLGTYFRPQRFLGGILGVFIVLTGVVVHFGHKDYLWCIIIHRFLIKLFVRKFRHHVGITQGRRI